MSSCDLAISERANERVSTNRSSLQAMTGWMSSFLIAPRNMNSRSQWSGPLGNLLERYDSETTLGPTSSRRSIPSCSLAILAAAPSGPSLNMKCEDGNIHPLALASALAASRAPMWSHGASGFRWPIKTAQGSPGGETNTKAERHIPPSGTSVMPKARLSSCLLNRQNLLSVAILVGEIERKGHICHSRFPCKPQ